MKSVIKNFIETHIDLIEYDQWDTFFNRLTSEFIPNVVRDVVSVLSSAGIDPLPMLSYIPDGYFMLSSEEKIIIPRNILSIGGLAFSASDIREIIIPSNVKLIRYSAFQDCDFLETVKIEEGVETIESYAFTSCEDLKTVFLPKSLRNIGTSVFDSCDNLDKIYYNGTFDDWKNVTGHSLVFHEIEFVQ